MRLASTELGENIVGDVVRVFQEGDARVMPTIIADRGAKQDTVSRVWLLLPLFHIPAGSGPQ